MIVGCYSMHLYCDTGNAKPGYPGDSGNSPHNHARPGFAEFTGPTEGDCKRQARKQGWRFSRDNKVYCPICSGK
jgi:hypothetical protein